MLYPLALAAAFSQFRFQGIEGGCAIGRNHADFIHVLCLDAVTGSAANTPNDKVDRAIAATTVLIVFIINLSQVIFV